MSSKWAGTKRPSRSRHYANIRVVRRVDLHTPTRAYIQNSRTPITEFEHATSSPPVFTFRVPVSSPTKSGYDKHHRQWLRWSKEVIPKLIPPYLDLVRASHNLRSIDRSDKPCGCGWAGRAITVTCISFESLSQRSVCVCNTAVNLIAAGYFPCAPLLPTLAVDIRMLEFARHLYLRTSPNRSAWSAALEAYYREQGFVLNGQDVIRRKLVKAARYYSLLRVRTNQFVRSQLRLHSTAAPAEQEGAGDWVDDEPMEYLKACCPACFTALRHDDNRVADVIVCLDANFTQKRRAPVRGQGVDPPVCHPTSCFLTEAEVAQCKSKVEGLRQPTEQQRTHARVGEDTIEPGMKVPAAVLESCNDSFKAADEMRTKASTKFFADTGLMALLCRHDNVLWLANMTSAGERQYYALALIEKLFGYLDADVTVGILYDIGCQLERSARKWGFIPDLMNRIAWGISVFHAYGHQWPCQLVYHPRKRTGFGFSDGEGCERFWSAIQFLIPTLRVSGYHQRLFTLDLQVEFLRDQSYEQLAKWIARKWNQCIKRCTEAYEQLDALGLEEDFLKLQWKEQVKAQTRPLTRASSQLANKEIQTILDLLDYAGMLKKEIQAVDRKLPNAVGTERMRELLEIREGLVAKKSEVEERADRQREGLGISEQQNLRRLLGNKYLELLLKARAVKDRLRAKLQYRKFELERVDKAYQRGTHNENKLRSQVLAGISKKESGITALMTRYNHMCADLAKLVREGKAPRGCIAPRPIPQDSLFSLDVDDPVWDDTGLQTPDGVLVQVPLWQGDEQVREGIKAWLVVERCAEEIERLQQECCALQEWIKEEWQLLAHSKDKLDNPGLQYQWCMRHHEIVRLCSIWKKDLSGIPLEGMDEVWGPETPLVSASAMTLTPETNEDEENEDHDNEEEGMLVGMIDEAVLLELEALGLHDLEVV